MDKFYVFRDSLVEELQKQISDLTLYLEEERLNHKQTKQKVNKLYTNKIIQNKETNRITETNIKLNITKHTNQKSGVKIYWCLTSVRIIPLILRQTVLEWFEEIGVPRVNH